MYMRVTSLQIAHLLMRHGHDVNVRLSPCKFYFQYTGTSLKMATERRCEKLVRFLLSHHADPDLAGKRSKKLATHMTLARF